MRRDGSIGRRQNKDLEFWSPDHIDEDEMDTRDGISAFKADPNRRRPQDIPGYFDRRDLGRLDLDELDATGELRSLSLDELEERSAKRAAVPEKNVKLRTPVRPRSETGGFKRAAPQAPVPSAPPALPQPQEDEEDSEGRRHQDVEKEEGFRSTWGSYPPKDPLIRTDAGNVSIAEDADLVTFRGQSEVVKVHKKRRKKLDGWLMGQPMKPEKEKKGRKRRGRLSEEEEQQQEEYEEPDPEEPSQAKYAKIYRALMRQLLPLPWDRVEGPVSWTDPANESWRDLGLQSRESLALISRLQRRGVLGPNVLQATAAPVLYERKDALLSSMTGSGKTFAFLVPLLARHILPLAKYQLSRVVDTSLPPHKIPKVWAKPRMLVVAPSRELAAQTFYIIKDLLEPFPELNCSLLIGGANYQRQDEFLKNRLPVVVVATPGRLLDHATEGRLLLDELAALVVDEVDMLLNISRSDQVDMLLAGLEKSDPKNETQHVLVSATSAASRVAKNFANRFLRGNWSVLGPSSSVELPPRVLHMAKTAPDITAKIRFLMRLARSHPRPRGILVFCNNWDRARKVSQQCRYEGITSAVISSNRTMSNRQKAIEWMNKGEIEILAATDLATRGLDFKQITHVVNFELPEDAITYAHRAGRCGRMGSNGIVISLASGGANNNRLNNLAEELGIELFEAHVLNSQLGVTEMASEMRKKRIGTVSAPKQLPVVQAAAGVW